MDVAMSSVANVVEHFKEVGPLVGPDREMTSGERQGRQEQLDAMEEAGRYLRNRHRGHRRQRRRLRLRHREVRVSVSLPGPRTPDDAPPPGPLLQRVHIPVLARALGSYSAADPVWFRVDTVRAFFLACTSWSTPRAGSSGSAWRQASWA
ncbi:hypothetical protein [Streptomyces sp. NPDC040750]|uniref:hypothetical protein n=1 Tax=Streptomyces sp. NPDC040750 TaxID=3154491 RepID=UPI0033D22A1F